MAKGKSIYSCSECGATSPKWQGQCPGCGEWNTLVESVAEKAGGHRFESLTPVARLVNLSEIETRESERIATGIAEFDRALGGASQIAESVVAQHAADQRARGPVGWWCGGRVAELDGRDEIDPAIEPW